VEAALKLARQVSGRGRYIGFLGGFHGRTMGSLSFTASKYTQQRGYFPAMPGVVHVPYPNPYRPLFAGDDQGRAVISYIEMLFERNLPPTEVAAILIEPIQGEGGYIVPPPGFLAALRALCDKHGIYLIFDEVQAGVGRTGKMFAWQQTGVRPDLITLAKGLGSGLPIGMMVGARKIMEKWPPGSHANTFGGNPVCCAAALATLKLVKGGFAENARVMGLRAVERLQKFAQEFKVVGDVRGAGLMIGVEFVKDRASKAPAKEFATRLVTRAFENGLLLLECGASGLRIIPPLMIGAPLLDEGLDILHRSIREVLAEGV
jgi:4-aminobutyrate aminotransferase